MKSVSTHVLDVSKGRPAAGVPISIEKKGIDSGWITCNSGATDADGRMKLIAEGALHEGVYRITFDTGAYFAAQGVEGFYPEAAIVFTVRDAAAHYHVPLLLSPYGYSTYRGS
jgi:5-hydroxyisourate hydrolase